MDADTVTWASFLLALVIVVVVAFGWAVGGPVWAFLAHHLHRR